MPAPALRAVVFDMDGTLVDSGTVVLEAVARGVRDVTARHGEPHDVSFDVLRAALGQPAGDYFRTILPPALEGLAAEVQEAATAYEVEAVHAAGEGLLFPGTLPALDALRVRGLQLACVSNAQGAYFRACLRFTGLGERLAYAECQDDLPSSARTPYKTTLLHRALAALEVDAGAALMVGDREEDIASGLEIGCGTVGASYGFGTDDELERANARIERVGALDTLVRNWNTRH